MAAAKKTTKKSTKATSKKAAAKKASSKKATAKKTTKKAAKKSTKKATTSAAETPMLISKSKVKEVLKGHGKRTDGDLYDALNEAVLARLADAAGRADGNGRSTVRPVDL